MRENDRAFLMEQNYATLFSLANKLQTKGDGYLEELTLRQFMAILAIAHLPKNEKKLNNIARKLGTSKQSVKQMISIVAKKGYVAMMPNEKDRRAVDIIITQKGKRVMMKCGDKAEGFLSDLFREFTVGDLKAMWTLLKKLYRFDGDKLDGFEQKAVL